MFATHYLVIGFAAAIVQILVFIKYYERYIINRFNMAIRQVFGLIPAFIICYHCVWNGIDYLGGVPLFLYFGVFVFFNFIPTIALIVFTLLSFDLPGDTDVPFMIFVIYLLIAIFTRQNDRY